MGLTLFGYFVVCLLFFFLFIIIITILYVETDINQAILQTILQIIWSSTSSDVLARTEE